MREMKDSGIEWIGEIPREWEISKAKYFIKMQNGSDPTTDGNVPVYGSGSESFKTCGEYKEGPTVLIGRKGTINTPRYIEGKYWNVDTAFDVHSLGKFNLKYYFYCAVSFDYKFYISQTTLPSMTQTNYENIFLPIPNSDEQRRIADFLDRKCAEIDAVIEKTKAAVEEYKKLKQSVITEAVTKGVRGPRPMKPSGVEWIGDVPEDVKISRVGLHFDIILGKMLCPNQIDETYTLEPYYCAADVHFDGISSDERKKMWFNKEEKELYRVNDGDLLIVEGGAGAGGCCIVNNQAEQTYIQNSIMIIRKNEKSDVRYLRYLIECLVKKGYVDIVCNKATIPHFTKDKVSCVPFLVFPLDEQQEISDYLDCKCAGIDNILDKKQQFIKELEAYKKSLIYEYVTGKKEVK